MYEVVTKLVGPINPVGETRRDAERLENLKVMGELVGALISEINGVALHANDDRHSVSKAGCLAELFLREFGIEKE